MGTKLTRLDSSRLAKTRSESKTKSESKIKSEPVKMSSDSTSIKSYVKTSPPTLEALNGPNLHTTLKNPSLEHKSREVKNSKPADDKNSKPADYKHSKAIDDIHSSFLSLDEKSALILHLRNFITAPEIHSRLVDTVSRSYRHNILASTHTTSTSSHTTSSLERKHNFGLKEVVNLCLELKLCAPPDGISSYLFQQFIEYCVVNWGAYPSQADVDDSFKFLALYDKFPSQVELTIFASELRGIYNSSHISPPSHPAILPVTAQTTTTLPTTTASPTITTASPPIITTSPIIATTDESIPSWVIIASQAFVYSKVKDRKDLNLNLNYKAKIEKDSDSDIEPCIICSSPFENGDRCIPLICMHIFHESSDKCPGIDTWIKRGNNSCPKCKSVVV